MKESRKEFIKKAHSAACSDWKTNIEKEFPKLFKEDALVVGKWYKSEGCLFNYQKQSNVYGFFTDGDWINGGWIWYGANAKPATDKEVEEALIKEAKKRGFKEGVRIKSKWMTNISANNLNGKFVFDNKFELCAEANRLMKYTIFEKGVWATTVKETITKEQAEKELGKTILN
jgi:hypothetical protein